METGLILKIYKMNYEFLVKNYLNPEMWQKEWVLFEYKEYKVTMNIWSIQTRDEQILLDIRLHYVDDYGRKNYKERTINFSLKIEDIGFLKRKINSAIFDLITTIEKEIVIQHTDYYLNLLEMKKEENNRLTDIANEFLDGVNVTNENLREAYIDAYVDEYAKVPDIISDYVNSRIYKEMPDLYLTWLSCIEDDTKKESRIETVKKAIDDNKYQEIMKDIEEYKKYMQTEEYTEEMQSNLEEV